eukprot:149681-Amorphochlora_amoeboformis.AAC.1
MEISEIAEDNLIRYPMLIDTTRFQPGFRLSVTSYHVISETFRRFEGVQVLREARVVLECSVHTYTLCNNQ